MMSRSMVIFSALIAAMSLTHTAQAATTLIDFEDAVRGSVLTDQYQGQGVLFSGSNLSGSGFQPGQVLNHTLGDLGVFNFGGSGNQSVLYGIALDILRIDFVQPDTTIQTTHDFVSLRVGDGDSSSEIWQVKFFDAAFVPVSIQQFTTASGPVGGGQTVSFHYAPGIARVEVAGIPGASGGAIDDLTFTSIPAPAMLPMTFVALTLLAVTRKRQA